MTESRLSASGSGRAGASVFERKPGHPGAQARTRSVPSSAGSGLGMTSAWTSVKPWFEDVGPLGGAVLPSIHRQLLLAAFQPLAAHLLRAVLAGDGLAVREGEDAAGLKALGDAREEAFGVGQPDGAPRGGDGIPDAQVVVEECAGSAWMNFSVGRRSQNARARATCKGEKSTPVTSPGRGTG